VIRARTAVALLAIAGAGAALAAEPEPPGYRGEPYRAPVPATLRGAVVVDDEAAHALWWSRRVAFIDVLPRAPRPEGLPEGTLWRDPPHASIPGALWLPNTGYDALADETLAYFRTGLATATEGDPTTPVVFFCLQDCWMSWNAAKRALELGYTRVFWYPAGTDGWAAFGLPLEEAKPFAP
jgi:PQQ-dependent catabolism-associated CXXCW motif protein